MACDTMRPNVLRRATSAAGSKRVSPPASVKSNEAMLPDHLRYEECIGAKKHLVLGLSHTGPPQGSKYPSGSGRLAD